MNTLIKSLIFAGLVTLTTSLTAQTVVQKPVVCDSKEKVIAAFTGEQFKEQPVWAGVGKEGNSITTFVIFVNEKSGTWSIVQLIDRWACIISVGDQFSLNSLELILNPSK